MATKFTDAQVASYIQNNALSGAGLQQAAQAFQLAPDQLARAQGLLSSGDASVAAADRKSVV
jgi:predicted component of type VI protein secretion system